MFFFLQRVVGLLLPRGWGVPIYNWKKAIYNFEKIKSKKKYVQLEKKIKNKKLKRLCTIPKVKTKKLQMKVFQFHT